MTLAQLEPSAKAPCTSTTVPIATMQLLFFDLDVPDSPPLGATPPQILRCYRSAVIPGSEATRVAYKSTTGIADPQRMKRC
jgi:hypothetical protein